MGSFDVICRECGYEGTRCDLSKHICPTCGNELYLKPFKMQVCIPTVDTKKVHRSIIENEKELEKLEIEEKEYNQEVKRIDDHFHREFYRHEIHKKMEQLPEGDELDEKVKHGEL